MTPPPRFSYAFLMEAVLQASVQQKTLSSMASDFDLRIKILPMPDYDTGLKMIRTGRTDLMVANRYLSVSISETEDLCVSPVIFHPTRLHVASPPTGHRLMLDAIDRHLVQWKSDPQSVYYRTLKHWTGEGPETVMPRYIQYVASAVAGLILLISAVAILLRWQVQVRTCELRRKTGDLEIALQKLKATQEKAIQQERLHALGQMASGIAHDFNNILTPIIGLAEALLLRPARLEDQDLVRKDLKNIVKAGYDGAKIVNRMKAFYRVYEPEESRLTDPCESIETVIELSRPRWARRRSTEPWHIDIKTRLTRGLYIRVRETEFREALLNLLGNAMDAMPSGGLVTVGVRQEARTVVVSVQDTGTGMSPDVKEKSLSAFFTTKGQAGTGIGLTMVKTFCDHSKAKLEIETGEGQGTTVSLIFPLHNRNAPDRLPESDSL